MATGRTAPKWLRIYGNGYDLSGYSRTFGPLVHVYDEADLTTIADAAKGFLPDKVNVGIGELNGVFDNTATSGLHVLANAGNSVWDMMVAIGIRAVPAQGDPTYTGKFLQTDYTAAEDGGAVVANVPFGMWDGGDLPAYDEVWGVLLHANSAVTAVNTAIGVDGLAATTAGGYMMYQVTAGNGTATLKVQHAAVNVDGSFADLGGATTGSINCAVVSAGIVNTTLITTAVSQFLRWQIVLGTATTVTFLLSFVRGR